MTIKYLLDEHIPLVYRTQMLQRYPQLQVWVIGRHVPGIFILNDDMTMGQIMEELMIVAEAALEDEYQDCISFMPLL